MARIDLSLKQGGSVIAVDGMDLTNITQGIVLRADRSGAWLSLDLTPDEIYVDGDKIQLEDMNGVKAAAFMQSLTAERLERDVLSKLGMGDKLGDVLVAYLKENTSE